ncbi:uncharacterized protein LOC143301606 [Babylonia areolata]|uniref:uncharacterized protein LOC143301606 n=1 Tax=Babylonia areolata TaxID=304850 RepID=UPI003FD07F5E
MKVAPCLLLVTLLFATAVQQSEGFGWAAAGVISQWILAALNTIIDAITKRYVRRELPQNLDPATTADVDKICKDFHLTEITGDGVTFQMIKMAFDKTDREDGKSDDKLDDGQLNDFLVAVEVFQHCLRKNAMAPAAAA